MGEKKIIKHNATEVWRIPNFDEGQTVAEVRLTRKRKMAAGFRLFARYGFDEGCAGHITVRDPEFPDTFWVNPFRVHFCQVKVSDLIRVDHSGKILEGKHELNVAAFSIHSQIHHHRPDVGAAAHTHAMYGRAWSALGRKLDPISQDACAFYQDHEVYKDFGGVVITTDEGANICRTMGNKKAAILENHGLLTVGQTIDEAVFWYIAMEKLAQSQLLAEAAAAGKPLSLIKHDIAVQSHSLMGTPEVGRIQFIPLYKKIIAEEPDLLE